MTGQQTHLSSSLIVHAASKAIAPLHRFAFIGATLHLLSFSNAMVAHKTEQIYAWERKAQHLAEPVESPYTWIKVIQNVHLRVLPLICQSQLLIPRSSGPFVLLSTAVVVSRVNIKTSLQC